MTYKRIANSITIITILAILAGCGPESNSRYGDEYWDPNKTKETFEPIDTPKYSVVYKDDTPADTTDEDWTAYVSIDFTDLNRRSKDGIVAAYMRGISEVKVFDDLMDGGVSNTSDTSFEYDYDNGIDRRLRANIPGDYTMVFDFDVIWPNGNTVTYEFSDIKFTVPGCQSVYGFYTDYINPILADKCVNCHNAGNASAAFDLDASNLTTRRNNFLSKIDADNLNEGTGTMLQYIFSSEHTGTTTAATIVNEPRTAFTNFISVLKSIDDDAADTRNITSDFTFETSDGASFCFARPSTMVVED